MALRKREQAPLEPTDVFSPLDRFFEGAPFRRPFWLDQLMTGEEMIRVDEYQEEGELVIKAELPGIDPDKDVEVTVSDHMLQISAERREEETMEKEGYRRHEIRRGSFSRTLPLPSGVSDDDVSASYHEGILEIHVPTPEAEPPKRISINKT